VMAGGGLLTVFPLPFMHHMGRKHVVFGMGVRGEHCGFWPGELGGRVPPGWAQGPNRRLFLPPGLGGH